MLSHLPGSRHAARTRPLTTIRAAKPRPASILPALLLALTVFLVIPLALPAVAQDAAPLEVASGPLSERTLVVTGHTVQTPDQAQLFGYVSAASGLTSQNLFVDDSSAVGAARLTFSADIALQPASNRADTTSYAGEGVLRVFLATDGGAAWEDPASFSTGELLAEYDLTLQETLQRQSAQVGVLVGDGVLTQTTANAITLDGTTYRFGTQGLVQRLRFTGALTPDTAGSTLDAVITGHAEVIRRDVTVVRLGQTGTPVAAEATVPPAAETPTAARACALEPWLGNAASALALANQGISDLDLSTVDSVDAAAVQGLADQIDAAIEAQRGSPPPAGAANANRLLVTALSTTSRGLRGIAEAAANGDSGTFDQASAALGDGQRLLTQAQGEIADLAATCPAG